MKNVLKCSLLMWPGYRKPDHPKQKQQVCMSLLRHNVGDRGRKFIPVRTDCHCCSAACKAVSDWGRWVGDIPMMMTIAGIKVQHMHRACFDSPRVVCTIGDAVG